MNSENDHFLVKTFPIVKMFVPTDILNVSSSIDLKLK